MTMFASDRIKAKVAEAQTKHHKEYRPYYRNAQIAIYLFVGMMVLGAVVARDDVWWAWVVAFIGFALFNWMPQWIYRLGNEDDRAYLHSCIELAEDEYDLAEMGFHKYDHIKEIVLNEMRNAPDAEELGWNSFIRELHKKYDLRKVVDEAEDYERSIA